MADRAYLKQPRDQKGRWTSGGARGLLARGPSGGRRFVRTQAGERRFNRPVGFETTSGAQTAGRGQLSFGGTGGARKGVTLAQARDMARPEPVAPAPTASAPPASKAAVARAQRLLDQVKTGKTIFFKLGKDWHIMGPAGDLQVGQIVTVTKANGQTSRVRVRSVVSERHVQGVTARTARFVEVADAEDEPRPGRARLVKDTFMGRGIRRDGEGFTMYEGIRGGGFNTQIWDES